MMNKKTNFTKLVSKEKTSTLNEIQLRIKNRAMLKESKQIAIKVLKKLDELNWSQRDLASKMEVSPQQINKIVKGQENLTLGTQRKLQDILDIPILASYYESTLDNSAKKTLKIKNISHLKFKLIKSKKQYNDYCTTLETLVFEKSKNKEIKEEIELLTLLIEHWDKEHNKLSDLDPVEFLKYLMKENNISQTDLVKITEVSKVWISEILNYKKGLSREVIRKLASYFKVSQEAFNKNYSLRLEDKQKLAVGVKLKSTKAFVNNKFSVSK